MKILNKITFLWKVHYLLIKQCLSRLWHFEENVTGLLLKYERNIKFFFFEIQSVSRFLILSFWILNFTKII